MTVIDSTAYRYRAAVPGDAEAIKALDGSFTTGTIFQVTAVDDGFALREITVDPPLTKAFPEDAYDGDGDGDGDGDDGDHRTFVALGAAGDLAGFVAVSYAGWNRRLTIEDIEVAPEHGAGGSAARWWGTRWSSPANGAPGTSGWRSPTSTRRRSTRTGGWASPSAGWTRPSTTAPPPRASRRST